jgi:hypothetical protein
MNEEFLTADSAASLNPDERAARIASLREAMQCCVDELDQLGLWQAGGYASMALASIDCQL